MPEQTAVTAATTAPAPLPAADLKWAEELRKDVSETTFATKALARLYEEFLGAVRTNKPARMEYLLSTNFSRPWPKKDVMLTADNIKTHFLHRNILDSAAETGSRDALKFLLDNKIHTASDVFYAADRLFAKGDVESIILLAKAAETDKPEQKHLREWMRKDALALKDADSVHNLIEKLPWLVTESDSLLSGALRRGVPDAVSSVIIEKSKQWLEGTGERQNGYIATAVFQNNTGALQKLITSGLDVNTYVNLGDNRGLKYDSIPLLYYAVSAHLTGVARVLLDNGAKVSAQPDSPSLATFALENKIYSAQRDTPASLFNLLLDKKLISVEDAREIQNRAEPGSTTIFMQRINQMFKEADAADPWRLLGPSQIGMNTFDVKTGLQLTELFNFATREHLIVSRNPETKTDTLLLRELFEEVKNSPVLAIATAQYEAKSGLKVKTPEAPKVAA